MFTVYCPIHEARVLIFPSGIDGVTNHRDGVTVHYHCTCGHRGARRTGRRR